MTLDKNATIRKGVLAFKNGSFEDAIIKLTPVIDKENTPTADQFMASEYLAASFERLGKPQEALQHARRMISLNDSSPKGYLRMGKILRILQDDEGAAAIYQIGLRRSKNGHDEIRQQAAKIVEKKTKCMPGHDLTLNPFALIPSVIMHRALLYFDRNDLKSFAKLLRLSQASHSCVSDYLSNCSDAPQLAPTNAKLNGLKPFMLSFPFDLKFSSADIFIHFLKMIAKSSRPLALRRLELSTIDCKVIDLALLNNAASMGHFQHLVSLTFKSSELSSELMNSLLQRSAIKSLSIYQCRTCSSASFMVGKPYASLKRLEILDCPGDASPLHMADVIMRMRCLKDLLWNGNDAPMFLSDRRLAALPRLQSFGVFVDFLWDAVSQVPNIKQVHIMSQPTTANFPFEALEFLYGLKNLHINGTFLKQRETPNLVFPNLEHLCLEGFSHLPKLSNWNMPRLKTICFVECDLMSIEQLPSLIGVRQILIYRNARYVRPAVFLTLTNAYKRGHFQVLGVGNIFQMYQSNCAAKVQELVNSSPLQYLLADDDEIFKRIQKIWTKL